MGGADHIAGCLFQRTAPGRTRSGRLGGAPRVRHRPRALAGAEREAAPSGDDRPTCRERGAQRVPDRASHRRLGDRSPLRRLSPRSRRAPWLDRTPARTALPQAALRRRFPLRPPAGGCSHVSLFVARRAVRETYRRGWRDLLNASRESSGTRAGRGQTLRPDADLLTVIEGFEDAAEKVRAGGVLAGELDWV
jgi:hypothetical protein